MSPSEACCCRKYWLHVTHPPALAARFTAPKKRFDAIQPSIPPLPRCNPGAGLCCVFFSSFPKRHLTTENMACVPAGTAVCPLSVLVEDEQRRSSQPSKSESGTGVFHRNKERPRRENRKRLITSRHAAGTVISPGALKDGAKHLRGGRNVAKDRTTAVSEPIGGTSILLSA